MSTSSINSSSPPKRRLSLFNFGNKKSSKNDHNTNCDENLSAQQQQPHHNYHHQHQKPQEQQHQKQKFVDVEDKNGPHDTDIQLMSPNSPLSLTDENLQNLNNITSLPPPSMSMKTNSSTNSSPQNENNHLQRQQHHQHQQQQFPNKLPSDTMSESSLIFERYVQDPFPTVPQYNPQQQQQQQQQQQSPSSPEQPQQTLQFPPSPFQRQNSFMGPTHLSTENFIPLLIDSTTTLIQSNTDLDEVDMIYSPRRSSVLNLSSAFHSPQQSLSRRASVANSNSGNLLQKSPLLDRSNSLFIATPQQQQQKTPNLKQRKSTISFLSYADMIQNEDQEQNIPRRPSMSQTLSSLYLANPQRSRNDSVNSNRTPGRQPMPFSNSPSLSRQPSGRNSLFLSKSNNQQQQQPQFGVNQKFQLTPDSPTSESSDNEDPILPERHNSRSLSNASSFRRQSRGGGHNNSLFHSNTNPNSISTPMSFSPSIGTSSSINDQTGSNTRSNSFSQNIDDVLERTSSCEPHEIVVSSVGDTLRQYKQDIRSA